MAGKPTKAQDPRYGAWYNDDVTDVPDDIRHLLETYSKIPPERVVAHVNELRAKAFEHNPFPCIGQFKFLLLTLRTHPAYPAVLARLSSPGAQFLDLGCCFGQDLRQLVADGAPAAACTGTDIDGPLIELGYDLFLDRATLASKFVAADAFDASAPEWSAVEGRIDVVNASAFFHLFPWARQVEAAQQIVRFLRPVPGSVVIGRQMGSLTPGEFPSMEPVTTGFRHSPDTLQRLWDEVGGKTGSRWRVEGSLDEVGVMGKGDSRKDGGDCPAWAEPNMRRLLFTITRL